MKNIELTPAECDILASLILQEIGRLAEIKTEFVSKNIDYSGVDDRINALHKILKDVSYENLDSIQFSRL